MENRAVADCALLCMAGRFNGLLRSAELETALLALAEPGGAVRHARLDRRLQEDDPRVSRTDLTACSSHVWVLRTFGLHLGCALSFARLRPNLAVIARSRAVPSGHLVPKIALDNLAVFRPVGPLWLSGV